MLMRVRIGEWGHLQTSSGQSPIIQTGGNMFFLNGLRRILSNEILIIFLIISYFLIFVNSKNFKKENYYRDYKIAKYTGILYGILTITALAALNIL